MVDWCGHMTGVFLDGKWHIPYIRIRHGLYVSTVFFSSKIPKLGSRESQHRHRWTWHSKAWGASLGHLLKICGWCLWKWGFTLKDLFKWGRWWESNLCSNNIKQQVLAGISVILGEIDDFFYQNYSQPEIISNKNSPYPVKNRLALWVEFM